MEQTAYKFHVQFHITSRCNLNCKHCYEGKGTTIDWTFEEFRTAIDKLWNCFDKWKVQGEISLIGGEPTMCPDFDKMVSYLHNRGDVGAISILSNGVNLSDYIIGVLTENKCFVQFSIDGINREAHDNIRGIGSYEKTISNIRKLKQYGVTPSIHYVLSKTTTPLSESFFDNLHSEGIRQLTFSRLIPIGNASLNEMLTKEETKEVFGFIDRMRRIYQERGLLIGSSRPLWCNYGYSGRCPVAIQTITIAEDGKIFPCRRLPIPLGNIKTDNFFKIWYTDERLNQLRNRKNIQKCGICPMLDICGGARCLAFSVYGDYMQEDPQCWIS